MAKADFVELKEFTPEQLNDKKFIAKYMNDALACYETDGNYNKFFRSLGLIIRSKYTLYRFSKKTGLGRTKMYQIFNCDSMPKLNTIVRMLRVLGYDIKIK